MYHYGQNKFSMSTKSLLGSVKQRQFRCWHSIRVNRFEDENISHYVGVSLHFGVNIMY